MLARTLGFFVWGLLAFVSVYWLQLLLDRPLPAPAHTVAVGAGTAPLADLTRLLGTTAEAAVEAAPVVQSRYRLVGLVAPKPGSDRHQGEGLAVIAIDNAPARAVRVGGAVDGQLQLLALDARSASLGAAGVVSLTLRLEPPAAAATGALPPVVAQPLPGQPSEAAPQRVEPQAESAPPPPRELPQQ